MDEKPSVLEIVGRVLAWIAAILCLLLGVLSLGSNAPIVLFPAAVLFAPIRPLQELLARLRIRRGVAVGIAVVLLLSGVMNFPAAQKEEADVTRVVITEKSTPAPTATPVPTVKPTSTPKPTPAPTPAEREYVLNTSSKKFHKPTCASVDDIGPGNRQSFTGTRDELLTMGYDPCGRCNP